MLCYLNHSEFQAMSPVFSCTLAITAAAGKRGILILQSWRSIAM